MYIVYAGVEYYPLGGANDIIGFYETFDLSLQKFREIESDYDWIHILDVEIKQIIKQKTMNNV